MILPGRATGKVYFSPSSGRRAPAGARRLQRRLDVGEGVHALGVEIIEADRLAIPIDRHLAGDENEFRCFDPRHMRVLAQRFAERVGIDDSDVRHGNLPRRGDLVTAQPLHYSAPRVAEDMTS